MAVTFSFDSQAHAEDRKRCHLISKTRTLERDPTSTGPDFDNALIFSSFRPNEVINKLQSRAQDRFVSTDSQASLSPKRRVHWSDPTAQATSPNPSSNVPDSCLARTTSLSPSNNPSTSPTVQYNDNVIIMAERGPADQYNG